MCMQSMHMRLPQMSTKTYIGAHQIRRQNSFGVLCQVSGMADAKEIRPQSPSERKCRPQNRVQYNIQR